EESCRVSLSAELFVGEEIVQEPDLSVCRVCQLARDVFTQDLINSSLQLHLVSAGSDLDPLGNDRRSRVIHIGSQRIRDRELFVWFAVEYSVKSHMNA